MPRVRRFQVVVEAALRKLDGLHWVEANFPRSLDCRGQ
jgi:hypothetical protein